MRPDQPAIARFRQQVITEYVERHPRSRDLRARAARSLGERLRTRLAALFDASPIPARVSGIGSLLQIHFTDAEIVDYRAAATADPALTSAFHLALLVEGIFSAPRGMMAMSLPVTDAEIEEALAAATRVLDRLHAVC